MSEQINSVVQIFLDESLVFYEVNAAGELLSSQFYLNFSALPKQACLRRCIILLPGQEIFFDTVSMPNTSRQNVMKALPFMLEDKLVGGTDQLHLVVDKIPNTHQYRVAAIDRARFEYYLSLIQQYGLMPIALIPDFLALPYDESSWTIKISYAVASVRCGRETGFTVAATHLPLSLQLKVKDSSPSDQIPVQLIVQDQNYDVAALSQVDTQFKFSRHESGPIFDANLFDQKPLMNFLHGQYRVKPVKNRHKNYWRYVAYAFIAWVVIIFAAKLLEGIVYHHQSVALESQVKVLTQELFPDQGDSDPKSLADFEIKKLTKAGHQDYFLMLLSRVASALRESAAVELKSLNYHDNKLVLVVKSAQLTIIENFSRALRQHGIIIKQNEVSTGENEITAELVVVGS